MIYRFTQTGIGQAAERMVVRGRSWLGAKLPQRRTAAAALIASLLAMLYWGVLASDRYVSEAHVVIHSTDMSSGKSGDAGAMVEQYLLRDYLLSVDMLNKLDAKLHLREHFSDWRRDPLSRMWSASRPLEWFHRYYLSRVSVELDPTAFVLVIQAQAFDPETAHAIAAMLVEEGERYMNEQGNRMAQEQVEFLEQQAAHLRERVTQDRQAVVSFQNTKGMVSPQGTAENIALIVSRLEAQLTELQTRLSAMQGYLMPSSSGIVDINMQISAIEKQIAREKRRLAAPNGQALNRTVEEYQRLQMKAEFSLAVYKTALTALEQGRINALRKLKQVLVLQSPTLPQYPQEPRRFYKIVVFMGTTLLLAGVMHLLAAIIRDHKD